MHLRVTAAALALASVLFAACFDFDATTAGGPLALTGDDASVVDGAPNGADANVGGGEGGGDAGASNDAAPDATTLSDGGPFCPSTPPGGQFFCDDFDDHALPGAWNTFGQTGGTLFETDAAAVSKPNALDLTTLPASTGQVVDVALRTVLTGSLPALPATLRFAFAIEPVQIDVTSGAAIVLGAVDFLDAAGNRYSLGLAINVSSGAPALTLGEQTGYADGGVVYVAHPFSTTLPLTMSAWNPVVIELDWTATTNVQAHVYVNGADELDVTTLNMTVQASQLQIGVGTSYVTEPGTAWELRYDNVLFTEN
jgi:hypothetical protein